MSSIEEIINILESAKDDTGSVPMRLVRQAFDKLLGSCEDAVSRKDAIVAVEKESQVDGAYGYMDTNSIVKLLNDLPSAESENIRCYECKHGIHSGCGDVYICHVSPELVMEHIGDFYCGYAEKRTDELGNS